jgi:Ala-tRNA(Pro) deacylase
MPKGAATLHNFNHMAKIVLKKVKKPAVKKKPIKGKKTVVKPKASPKLPEKVIKYLEVAGIKHDILEHRTVYTAMDAAATMKRKIDEIAKSLLVKADKDYYLVLLPADQKLNFEKLAKAISKHKKITIKSIKIPGEEIVKELTKAKNATLSAFGGLHGLPVVLDQKLAKAKKAIFSSGSFNHSIEMAVKDYMSKEQPILGLFGDKKKIKVQKVVKKVVKKVKKSIAKKK